MEDIASDLESIRSGLTSDIENCSPNCTYDDVDYQASDLDLIIDRLRDY